MATSSSLSTDDSGAPGRHLRADAVGSQTRRSSAAARPGSLPSSSILTQLCYDYIVGTHIWVASAVTSLTAFACVRLRLDLDSVTLAIAFSSTLLIYNLDTALDLQQRPLEENDDHADIRSAARQRRAQWLSVFALLTLVLELSLARAQTTLLVVLGAGVSCLYAVPLGSRRLRLKAVPGSKSLVVGGAVAIAAVSVPLSEQATGWSSAAGTTLAWLSILTVANATLFDVRDLDQDAARGLKTLVVLFGVRRVRLALVGLLSVGFLLAASVDPTLATLSLVLWLFMVPLTLCLGPESPRAVFALGLDGALFLPWLFTLGV